MSKVNNVDEYILLHKEHSAMLYQLRNIMLEFSLEETIKWGGPVYTYNSKNVIGMGVFKSFISIWFFQGVFLKDKAKVLINAQEGTTKALRQWRFSFNEKIPFQIVKTYVQEAIDNQKKNKKINQVKAAKHITPKILMEALKETPDLNEAYQSFTIARQNEFCAYIDQAKMEFTRINRLKKIIPMILQGEGLNDRYKK